MSLAVSSPGILCPRPPDVPHGSHSGEALLDFAYGTEVAYTCGSHPDTGAPYLLVGEPTLRCLGDSQGRGVWSGPGPRCDPPPPAGQCAPGRGYLGGAGSQGLACVCRAQRGQALPSAHCRLPTGLLPPSCWREPGTQRTVGPGLGQPRCWTQVLRVDLKKRVPCVPSDTHNQELGHVRQGDSGQWPRPGRDQALAEPPEREWGPPPSAPGPWSRTAGPFLCVCLPLTAPVSPRPQPPGGTGGSSASASLGARSTTQRPADRGWAGPASTLPSSSGPQCH